MKIRTLIVDDEAPARARIRQLLKDEADFEIALEEGEFLLQTHLLRFAQIERSPKQFAEARDDAIGGFRVIVDQGGYRVERVEQKVRVQLHPQRLQLSLGQPPRKSPLAGGGCPVKRKWVLGV